MIIRQFCARHGRTAISRSSSRVRSARYATTVSADDLNTKPHHNDRAAPISIPGHPDEASGLLDTSALPPTPATRILFDALEATQSSIQAAQLEINAYTSAHTSGLTADPNTLSTSSTDPATETTSATVAALQAYHKQRLQLHRESQHGTHITSAYSPDDLLINPPTPETLTLPDLLANQTHLGHHTSLWNPSNSTYISGIRSSIHIISLETTYAYLLRASKVIRRVAHHGGLILFIGTRRTFAPTVVSAARRAGGYHIFDRWVPGTLTNGQQLLANAAIKIVDVADRHVTTYDGLLAKQKHSVIRPDLVVCLNPLENEVMLHECGLNTVPTIGIVDTDVNPAWVTYPIPANDDSLRSVGLIAGVLSQAARQGQASRLAEAKMGKATYDTSAVKEWITRAEELGSLDITEGEGGAEEKDEDADKETAKA